MPSEQQIPLLLVSPSVDAQFCDFKTVKDWLVYFTENIVGNGASISALFTNDIIFSPTPPTGANIGKIWVNTTTKPRGIGLFIDGAWVVIPIPEDAEIPDPVPVGVIMPWTGTGEVPEGYGTFPQSAATALGLPTLTGAQWLIKSN